MSPRLSVVGSKQVGIVLTNRLHTGADTATPCVIAKKEISFTASDMTSNWVGSGFPACLRQDRMSGQLLSRAIVSLGLTSITREMEKEAK